MSLRSTRKPRNHTGVWFFRHERDAECFLAAFRVAGWIDAAGSPLGAAPRRVQSDPAS